ncbi:MAG TPA: type II toxin-antitoxin system VapC family toxin [Chitinophagales bacterium]|nr:type II toxin-antitoxin system VapC family toxin [Chitinophagales bacterium]
MKVIIDTQVYLWYINGEKKLTSASKSVFESYDTDRLISVASMWEIAIKNSIGKLPLKVPFQNLFHRQGYNYIQISDAALNLLHKLPYYKHRDPFDRMLAAQCLSENISIISSDSAFDLYGVNRIW